MIKCHRKELKNQAMDTLHLKLQFLEQYLKNLGSAAVAFSGGVDSAFLMAAAHRALGTAAIAVTARSCAFPRRELEEARKLARAEGISHIEFDFQAFRVEEFVKNPPDRCYHCKSAILKQMKEIAEAEGLACVIEGSNADDEKDYRPGAKAVYEQGILSPLKEAGLTKEEIRLLSREWGLPTWKKQSAACLASRFAYGEPITEERLFMVEQAENYLHEHGFDRLRVRIHGTMARIELSDADFPRAVEPEFRYEVSEAFRKLGFSYVTLDMQGYRMGSMNEVLKRE